MAAVTDKYSYTNSDVGTQHRRRTAVVCSFECCVLFLPIRDHLAVDLQEKRHPTAKQIQFSIIVSNWWLEGKSSVMIAGANHIVTDGLTDY